MRVLALLPQCSCCCRLADRSALGPSATLVLTNPTWERVNVEAVVTKSPDCDERRGLSLDARIRDDQRAHPAARGAACREHLLAARPQPEQSGRRRLVGMEPGDLVSRPDHGNRSITDCFAGFRWTTGGVRGVTARQLPATAPCRSSRSRRYRAGAISRRRTTRSKSRDARSDQGADPGSAGRQRATTRNQAKYANPFPTMPRNSAASHCFA